MFFGHDSSAKLTDDSSNNELKIKTHDEIKKNKILALPKKESPRENLIKMAELLSESKQIIRELIDDRSMLKKEIENLKATSEVKKKENEFGEEEKKICENELDKKGCETDSNEALNERESKMQFKAGKIENTTKENIHIQEKFKESKKVRKTLENLALPIKKHESNRFESKEQRKLFREFLKMAKLKKRKLSKKQSKISSSKTENLQKRKKIKKQRKFQQRKSSNMSKNLKEKALVRYETRKNNNQIVVDPREKYLCEHTYLESGSDNIEVEAFNSNKNVSNNFNSVFSHREDFSFKELSDKNEKNLDVKFSNNFVLANKSRLASRITFRLQNNSANILSKNNFQTNNQNAFININPVPFNQFVTNAVDEEDAQKVKKAASVDSRLNLMVSKSATYTGHKKFTDLSALNEGIKSTDEISLKKRFIINDKMSRISFKIADPFDYTRNINSTDVALQNSCKIATKSVCIGKEIADSKCEELVKKVEKQTKKRITHNKKYKKSETKDKKPENEFKTKAKKNIQKQSPAKIFKNKKKEENINQKLLMHKKVIENFLVEKVIIYNFLLTIIITKKKNFNDNNQISKVKKQIESHQCFFYRLC